MDGAAKEPLKILFRFGEAAARAASHLVPGDVLWYADTTDPVFALTFDDGPSPACTPGLLEVLARHRARATFFLIGERARDHPELVAAIVAGGHEIANHLMRDERSALKPESEFRRELAATSEVLRPYGIVRFFRPGAGFFTPSMLRSGADLGLQAVLGTVAAADRGEPGDERIARRLAAGIRPGTIAVLHEGTPGRRAVVPTTDQLLSALAGRGLASVTLSELVGAPPAPRR
jgi:peptidoglycan-N-acetylglucosamine deacetylase